VPIALRDRTLGILRLDSDLPGSFALADARLLEPLAGAAAIAIENARLYDEMRQRLDEQAALLEAITAISSSLDLTAVLNAITRQLGQVVGATSAYLCSYDVEQMTSTVLSEYFAPHASAQERVSDLGVVYALPRDFSADFERLRAGHSEISHVDDPGMDEQRLGHMRRFGACTILNIPLRVGGELIAFAELWDSRRRREFSAQMISLGQGIAQQGAIALKDAQLYNYARRELVERRRSEARREELIAELQDALKRIKTLSGLLPICSSCKKIRDDRGSWQRIEAYVEQHSEAEFSHGLCPECARDLYPGFDYVE
jgi:GAF domain-containing protein